MILILRCRHAAARARSGSRATQQYIAKQLYILAAILGTVSVFAVLAEPHRRQILDLLGDAERPAGELGAELELSQPAVSKHLRILREAGLVEVRGEAQRRLYRVRPEPLRAIDIWLAPYRQMWASRLEDLERHLDAMADNDPPNKEQ